ncbi:MAG: hypothetical protein ACNS60_20465 [Candidatus Cyclobacteriaceae bacterium M2_1C_046]
MFDSVVLDVVIGLIFIFLLYSLLASVISEMTAVIMGMRARNLAQAICRMLEDEKPDKGGWWRNNKLAYLIRNIYNELRILFTGKRGGPAFRAFYSHPAIKYLAVNKFFSKPSYMPPDTFSKVVIDIIRSSGNKYAINEQEKISSGLTNGESDSEKLKAINRILEHNDTDTALESIRMITNRQGLPLISGETRSYLASLLDDAQNDLEIFQLKLEKWFDETMERATGWYKRTIQLIIFIIGFMLAVLFNANTLEIVDILSKDKEAREQMVQLASAYIENNPRPVAPVNTNEFASYEEMQNKYDSLLLVRDQIINDIEEANMVMGMGWNISAEHELIKKDQKVKNPDKQNLIFIKDTANQYLYIADNFRLHPERVRNSYDSLDLHNNVLFLNTSEYICYSIFNFKNFIGYLLTALAISLGAPFWFDLLNKIVQVRSSIKKTPARTKEN